MNPTIEQARQKYFFQLVQTVRFNYNDAEFLKNAEQQLLSEYEDLIPPSELQRIKGLTDPVEKILSLIDAARKTSLSEDPSSLGNLAENLRIYQENQKEVAKAQAESEIAKKTVHTPYKWFGEYVQTVTSTLGEIPNTTEIDPEIVAAALINDPRAAESITQIFGFSDPTTTPIDTAISMADVIPPIAESNFHPEISYIYEEAKNQTGSLPDTVAGANTFLKSGLPSATQTNFQDLNQKIQVLLEAKTGSTITIPDSLSTTISDLNLNISPEQLLTQTLTTRLSRENIPQPAVQQLVKFMPAIYVISSYTPIKSADNKRGIDEKKSQVFQALTQAVLSQFGIIRPESLQNLSYAWIYSATRSYYESQAYNYQPQLQNNGQNHEYDPRLSFVYQSAKNYVTDYGQDFVVNAALDAAVAGPLGAWILPAGPINIMMDVATAAEVAAAAPAAGAVTTAAVGGAAVATGAEVGAATGAAAGGPIAPLTALIGAIIGFLIVKGKDIFSWLKKQTKNLILLLGGGIAILGAGLGAALAGIAGLGFAGAVVGAGVGAVGFTALTGGSKALSAFASKATAFTGALVGLAAVEIGTTIIIIAISIPIVIALILFIINTSAFVVPPNYDEFSTQSNITPPNEQINCTTTVTPLGLPTPSNSVAAKALKIVDNLKQGFWCYWNNSPDYPELFNQSYYLTFPNPCYNGSYPPGCAGSRPGGYDLFWCTWLVIKAYEDIGVPSVELGANTMMNSWFVGKGTLIYNTPGLITGGTTKVKSGDIAFINVPGDPPGYAGHVAIVYNVSIDFVMTVDSNAATKTHSYTVDANGSLQPQYGLSVIGFGRLP